MKESSSMRRSMPAAGVPLLAIAGALFIIGAFVTAATVTVQGQSSTATLWDGWEGKASLILGIAILGSAAILWMSERSSRAAGWTIAIVGLVATVFAIFKIVSIESEAVDSLAAVTAAQRGIPLEAAKQAAQQLFDMGIASV
jgi:hypothetical protein